MCATCCWTPTLTAAGDYKEKGSTVEFWARRSRWGRRAAVKVTLKNGDIIYDYLDPDTFYRDPREIQQFIRGSVRDRGGIRVI